MGVRLFSGLSVGTNLKRLITNASLDGLSHGAAAGWGVDFGILFSPVVLMPVLNGLKFGVMAHDITDTKVEYDNGVSEVMFEIS